MTAAGVGQWITRFRYKRESDDEIIEDTNHAASASFDFLRSSPVPPRRKRLKRCLSPIQDLSPSEKWSPPCSVNPQDSDSPPLPPASLDVIERETPRADSSFTTDEEQQQNLAETREESEDSLKPTKAVAQDPLTHCLTISSSLTNHLVNAFCGGDTTASEEDQELIRSKIQFGRAAVTRVPQPTTQKLLDELSALQHPEYKQLKEYQLVGILWLLALHEQQHCGILADDMGLGKTAQAATFLRLAYVSRKSIQAPSLIICPATLVDNWVSELSLWAPELRVVKYRGTQKERRALLLSLESQQEDAGVSPMNIVIASLQSVSNRWDRHMFFKRYHFGYVLVDEAHNLKNNASQMHQHLKKSISSDHRLLLTGSPIQNEISELQNLLLLLLPHTVTCQRLNKAMEQYTATSTSDAALAVESSSKTPGCPPSVADLNIQFLQTMVSPFILRRLKCEVMDNLPPKSYVIERCPLEGRQKSLYTSEVAQATSTMGKELAKLFQHNRLENADGDAVATAADELFSSAASNQTSSKDMKNLLFRLRRICNHPLLYRGYYSADVIEKLAQLYHKESLREGKPQPLERLQHDIQTTWSDYDVHKAMCDFKTLDEHKLPAEMFLNSAKIKRMLDILDTRVSAGSKVLVFSQFTTYLDIIEATLELHRPEIGYCRMDGATSINERQALTKTFSVDPDVSVFLLSTKAAGVGLNLTAADSVILMDQDWNPHNDRQAEDRVHRIGQTRPVTIYRLCCQDTLEETIIEIGQRKLHLDRAFGGTVNDYRTADAHRNV